MNKKEFNDTPLFNAAKTCTVTGHRALPEGFDKKKLKSVFKKLIDGGYDTFLIGMALGFDTLCFQILTELKKSNNVKIIACVPCLSQAAKYTEEQRTEYDKMLSLADDRVLISENYTPYCMLKRNRFMVDNSSLLVAYVKREKTGSSYTRAYALKRKIAVINLD